MKSLRSRFILSHLIPFFIVVPLFGIGISYILETQILLRDISDRLTEQANLIAESFQAYPNIWENQAQADKFVISVSQHIDGNVTLILPSGNLLASSDPLTNEGQQETINPQGILEAIQGQTSVKMVYNFNFQKGEVYLPVFDPNQQLLGIIGISHTLQGALTQFSSLRRLLLAIIVLEMVIGSIVGFILAIRLERPIKKATKAVTEIAEGERIEPIRGEGPDEIKQLSVSVNYLAEKLRSAEITRRRLLANIVHELGRPLGAILSAIHALRKGAVEDPDIRTELLEGIENEINQMQPMLDDLAQLHGQDLGTTKIIAQPVEISEWLPSILLPWRSSALEKGLQWKATIPPKLPIIQLDPDRIAQVIGNLLSNAIKYSNTGGSVSVKAGSNDNSIWIEVSDNGLGISSDEQERIFEPFYRSSQHKRFPQGLGLGLTIARDLVVAHGGTLELISSTSKGSTFIVNLPRK
jgi:signal transduction histidine kinase